MVFQNTSNKHMLLKPLYLGLALVMPVQVNIDVK